MLSQQIGFYFVDLTVDSIRKFVPDNWVLLGTRNFHFFASMGRYAQKISHDAAQNIAVIAFLPRTNHYAVIAHRSSLQADEPIEIWDSLNPEAKSPGADLRLVAERFLAWVLANGRKAAHFIIMHPCRLQKKKRLCNTSDSKSHYARVRSQAPSGFLSQPHKVSLGKCKKGRNGSRLYGFVNPHRNNLWHANVTITKRSIFGRRMVS